MYTKSIHALVSVYDYFYVGQTYAPHASSSIAHSQIYVEHLMPASVTQKFPLVMIHGFGMTATNWLSTPDGGKGWADWFLEKGFEVYLIDQPSRGRSAHQIPIDGPLYMLDTLAVQQMFTAPAKYNLWPSAKLHTQWPGSGVAGDVAFDHFYASVMPSLSNMVEASEKIRDAGAKLLDIIGRPVILITHSQATQFGWLIADVQPSLVKAIVNLDPAGPPFFDSAIFQAPSPSSASPEPPQARKFTPARPYGLTEIPITYSPPISSPSELSVQIYFIHAQQELPARKLINLVNIPELAVTAEASYHSVYDHCSVAFLQQAGVPVEHVKLAEVGIRGNGHMMFLEKNGLEILERVVGPWIERVTT
ncbi:alpha/beta-hydrolase [Gymnopus androsaceus JB14]|uniref:Alpha/beta-hydrolase n=1 Tax=Gymnopus androsaceus JB14 TaxID=1447944 RepID=A0A6A4HYJ8_9AGAR|nr:alpha/beta-hydrolase [Gymnopus androsaceus JB14]